MPERKSKITEYRGSKAIEYLVACFTVVMAAAAFYQPIKDVMNSQPNAGLALIVAFVFGFIIMLILGTIYNLLFFRENKERDKKVQKKIKSSLWTWVMGWVIFFLGLTFIYSLGFFSFVVPNIVEQNTYTVAIATGVLTTAIYSLFQKTILA